MKLNNTLKNSIAPMALVLVASTSALAGTDTTFDAIYQQIRGWAEGSLGKLMAVSAFLIGMGIGLVRQSAIAVVVGLTFALIFAFGPSIIDSIVTLAV
jgi:conjugal transfer pilus assembly protein TraA